MEAHRDSAKIEATRVAASTNSVRSTDGVNDVPMVAVAVMVFPLATIETAARIASDEADELESSACVTDTEPFSASDAATLAVLPAWVAATVPTSDREPAALAVLPASVMLAEADIGTVPIAPVADMVLSACVIEAEAEREIDAPLDTD